MTKLFKHNFVTPIVLPRDVYNNERFYVLPDGTKLKSVTTVLGQKLDKSGLDAWKEAVGEEEAKRVSNIASRRGSIVHGMAEKYLLNEKNIFKGEMPFNIASFKPIQKVLDQYVDNLYGIELPLYSKALLAAGTSDLVCNFDGIPSIVDFKTSKRIKELDWIEGYILQCTAYSLMFQQMYKINIPQIVIIITVDHEDAAQVFKLDRAAYIDRTIEVFTS